MRIAIEANIGAGKSTIIAALREAFPDVPMHVEPVDAWRDMLAAFYDNRNRWAFALQMMILKEYVGPKYRGKKTFVSERCMYSCRYVFGQTLFSEGSLTEKEWKLFKDYCDAFEADVAPDVIVYVRTDPATCLERIAARGRPAEEPMTLEYLQKLNFQYENIVKYFPGVVRVVDGDRAANVVYKDVENIVREYVGDVRSADQAGDQV
jgi:deoxyadenosine/deoxycytidine kinase